MLIVDSQIHLWENGKMSAHHRQIPTYSMDDALAEMAAAGVDAAVIHPPSTLGEAVNVLAVEAVRRHPDKFCILGHFDLESPDRENIVKNWRQRPGMLGFRFTFNQPHQKAGGPTARSTGSGRRARRRAAGRPAGRRQYGGAGKIAARHPGLKLHIDHFGRAGGGSAGTDDAAFADLGRCWRSPNSPMSAVKLSGAPSYSSHPTPTATFTIFTPDLRRVRARALLLGHRYHPHAVLVSAMRDDVHRRDALAQGPRPRTSDGWRGRRLARLEAPRRLIARRRAMNFGRNPALALAVRRASAYLL